jgi:hypothetical protein
VSVKRQGCIQKILKMLGMHKTSSYMHLPCHLPKKAAFLPTSGFPRCGIAFKENQLACLITHRVLFAASNPGLLLSG